MTFGSYNTERYTKDSDIDVGFISKVTPDMDQKLNLLTDIIFFFGRDGIDLVDLSIGTPLLLYEIACESNVLYEENDSYLRFKVKAGARYAHAKN